LPVWANFSILYGLVEFGNRSAASVVSQFENLLFLLMEKLASVALIGSAQGLLENQLADSDTGNQFNFHCSVINNFELYGAWKSCVDSWSSNVNADPKSSQGTLALYAGCNAG
jgi:hypothetical protein